MTFLIEHWVSLLFSLLTAGALAYCRHLGKKLNSYKTLAKEDQEEKLNEKIEEYLKPLQEELKQTKEKFDAIKDSYRFRLISLCEKYLDRGYLTSKEYSSLSEMWKVYHELGGNSQAEEFYHKVERLPVHE